jgi:hypothetical protein
MTWRLGVTWCSEEGIRLACHFPRGSVEPLEAAVIGGRGDLVERADPSPRTHFRNLEPD